MEAALVDLTDGSVVAEVAKCGTAETRRAIEAAERAQVGWRNATAKERAALLRKWLELTLAAQEDLAQIMTAEQGKPLVEARGEIPCRILGVGRREWDDAELRKRAGEAIAANVNLRQISALKEALAKKAAALQESVNTLAAKAEELRQQIEQLVIGTADKIIQVPLALYQALAATLDLRLDAVVVTGGTLGVEVPDKCRRTFTGGQPGKIDSGGPGRFDAPGFMLQILRVNLAVRCVQGCQVNRISTGYADKGCAPHIHIFDGFDGVVNCF